MNKLIAASLVFALGGCGALFNQQAVMVTPPPGATIDGQPGPQPLIQKRPHEVVYPDGRRCVLTPEIKTIYLVLDLFSLAGIIVDAVTDDWRVLNAGFCPGVIVQQ